MHSYRLLLAVAISVAGFCHATEPDWQTVMLRSSTSDMVRPWTGIVLWHDHAEVDTVAISMEYSYVGYDQCVDDRGQLRWELVEERLDAAANRSHQSILRFYFVYPGRKAAVPEHLRVDGYAGQWAKSEGRRTEFVDWRNETLQDWLIEFHREFARRYDDDPRLAAVQVGFGLWGEYHIYDGPLKIGRTFPSHDYQARFLTALDQCYAATPWMISIDAADDELSPIVGRDDLMRLKFGLFDDSFLSEEHPRYNAVNWAALRSGASSRYAGGELNYYSDRDQRLALSVDGPHGQSYESAAKQFGISFMIGNDQPRHQSITRVRAASLASGYRLAVVARKTNGRATRLTIQNVGIAPPPHPIDVRIGASEPQRLPALSPGSTHQFNFDVAAGQVQLDSPRLVDGQSIPLDVVASRP